MKTDNIEEQELDHLVVKINKYNNMAYIQKNSPLNQDAKFMTKQYDKTRQNMSASGEKAFKKGQSEAAITAASFVPIGKVVGGVVKLAKGITNLSKVSKTVKATTKTEVLMPKGSGSYKHFGEGNEKVANIIIQQTKNKAKALDKVNLKNAKFEPFETGTPRMGMKVDFGKGLSQNYYKSSSLANKKFTQGPYKGQGTFGKWVPFEGKLNRAGNKDWFVKNKDWETGYGSSTNRYLMHNMDKHLPANLAKNANQRISDFKKWYESINKLNK